jgi:hypothetical protein
VSIFFNSKKKRRKIDQLKREYAFYKPIFELVSQDVHWVKLNWRLLRYLLKKFESNYELNHLRKETTTQLDHQSNEYILMIINFFEKRISKLQEYFDSYYMTIPPIMNTSPDFFYGHFNQVLKLTKVIKTEVTSNHISLLRLRYLHNFVFFFYLEIVEGINRIEVVSREQLTLN